MARFANSSLGLEGYKKAALKTCVDTNRKLKVAMACQV